MKLYYEGKKYGAYGYSFKLKRIKDLQHLSEIMKVRFNEDTPLGVVASTKVGWRKWIPVIDCDSVNAKDSTILTLGTMNYCVVESSNGRYWIFVDNISSFDNALWFMRLFSKQDPHYILMCNRIDKIVVRAFPKEGKIVQFPEIKGSPYFVKWITEFKQWWKNSIHEWIQQEYILKEFTNVKMSPIWGEMHFY